MNLLLVVVCKNMCCYTKKCFMLTPHGGTTAVISITIELGNKSTEHTTCFFYLFSNIDDKNDVCFLVFY
jgi:hypothetical protein